MILITFTIIDRSTNWDMNACFVVNGGEYKIGKDIYLSMYLSMYLSIFI